MAARAMGGRAGYLTVLATMALRMDEQPMGWPARSFLPTRGTFLRRIEMLRDSRETTGRTRGMLATAALAALASPLVFLGGAAASIAGIILWGIGMGAQESVMRAIIAAMTPPDRRGTAYGILNAVFGFAWFAGSILLGIIYDQSVMAVAILSFGLQLLSLPFLIAIIRQSAEQAHGLVNGTRSP